MSINQPHRWGSTTATVDHPHWHSGRLLICYTAEQRTRLVRSDQPTQATVTELLTVIHNFFTHQLGKGHILGLLSSPTRCVHVKFLLCCASTDGLRRYT
ncbi:hypothetical protein AV530_000588 [Patagioenas fasciata monilis]|uniref:Uncharacterized protein n=1 Tax=Patagioenas fasciata monilis TaxID=372326 RepID=A0A1V4IGP9_PATFA|nr:hypothetical protein AV530_000588 [Patagioenas fasciata monilis]